MDGAAAQVLDGANNFEETQSKFPNLRETRSKLGKVKGAVPVCGGGCSFLEKQHIIQKMKPNHHIVKMVQYDQKYWNQKDLTSNHLTLRAQSGITLRNHSDIIERSLRDHSRYHSGITQRTLKEHKENMPRTRCCYFCICLKNCSLRKFKLPSLCFNHCHLVLLEEGGSKEVKEFPPRRAFSSGNLRF